MQDVTGVTSLGSETGNAQSRRPVIWYMVHVQNWTN